METEKRFVIYKFPSLYGTGWKTDSLIFSILFAVIRFIGNPFSEIVITDTRPDKFIFRL